jgi:hypothetical protein
MVEGLWIGVLGGSIAGLVTAIGAHAILAGPLVRVKVRDDATWDASTGSWHVFSHVRVSNVRGRPVIVEGVAFLVPGDIRSLGSWADLLPARLDEGETVILPFDRQDPAAPRKTVPVVRDSALRIWPRRRSIGIRLRAVQTSGVMGAFLGGRRGPSSRSLAKATRHYRRPKGNGSS